MFPNFKKKEDKGQKLSRYRKLGRRQRRRERKSYLVLSSWLKLSEFIIKV